MSNVLEIDRLVNVIHRRCASHNVTLKFDDYAVTASTDGSTIRIPTVYQPITKDAMDKLHGFVIHECGHHARPEAFEILKALPKDTPEAICALFNIVEDDGMERDVARAYAGDAIALGRQNAVILKELDEAWTKAADEWPEEPTVQEIAPVSCCGLGQLSRLEWDGISNATRGAFFKNMHPVAKKLTDDLAGEGYVDKMLATTTPDECWDLAMDLYERLYPDSDQEENDKTRAQGHSKEPAPPEEGEGQGTAKEVGEGEGEEVQGAAEVPQQGTVVNWKDAVLSEHNEWQAKEEGAVAGNIGIDWTDYKKGTVQLMNRDDINVVDLRDKKHKVEVRNDWLNIGTPESFMADNSGAASFGNQIRRYIQAKAKTRVQRDKKHGRIDKGNLYKLAMPPVDGGDWNKRIFYSHTDKKELDTCIHVLTDWSGSMQGDKMKHAADASGRLIHVFDRVLRVPVQLAAFSDSHSPCDIGLIKSFKDHSISPQQIAERFSKFYKFSSANNDADALMWAYNQTVRRKEKRKIIIVLSDGCPAGGIGYGYGSTNLTHVTKSIEKAGRVELYGVGIMSDAVNTYYTNAQVLDDPLQINNVLFEIIKKGVK